MDFDYSIFRMEVTLSGKKLPFSQDWIYFIRVDNERKYSFTWSGGKLTVEEMLEIQENYRIALDL